ncbi:bacteriophage antitermination protein Q [Arsenophonus nasoniae]|uniref:Phage antitermination protein Q n=1 Tax=Arsenophonus nasoniae TaxID=638 RepID=D2U457_9GAMM|nr:bacteriophage antitermination protein Q [Arsenophonus nasoniae]QBY45031.1 Phage antitermination protein Q [Arsenophonus nasoniae]WGM05251.1 bacteriophage antitermination protein Q [Arsenophonus nasoniae]WGM10262.1 bacteriophage antitermination protein Q [Arsenophonus nasoniae]WGM14977.1 bacteriophage antitermination protein Q [Arsenophonus nasoniae]CBA76301.1 phage transcriptional regulator [Arsenophonus nasoniae]
MTEHDLGYFRSVAKYAFRDWTVNTGQLEALTCKSAMETKRYPRVKKREIKLAGHSVCRITDPVKVTETRRSGREIPLIEYPAYFYCHERRVIRQLADHQRSWILYCYCHEMNFQHQVNICSYLWRKFTYQTADIKITKKVKERLKILVWLCVQQCADSFSGLANQGYSQSDLAKLMGMKRDNWKKNYHHFWLRLISICKALDREALCQIAESV